MTDLDLNQNQSMLHILTKNIRRYPRKSICTTRKNNSGNRYNFIITVWKGVKFFHFLCSIRLEGLFLDYLTFRLCNLLIL